MALPLRGVHNVVNATGAIAMAKAVGVPFATCVDALARFGGVARRFDIRGLDGGATFVDDYAHLPAEIAAVIAAALLIPGVCGVLGSSSLPRTTRTPCTSGSHEGVWVGAGALPDVEALDL